MDDLLREFLTETTENLGVVDSELVRFEQEPNNAQILDKIFRLIHTIKGTCGFLGLSRLETLTHAAETLMGKFRDGMPVTGEAVTVILSTIDRIKDMLDALEQEQRESDGDNSDLIAKLAGMARADSMAASQSAPGSLPQAPLPASPGTVSLEELERAFRQAPGPNIAPKPPEPDTPSRDELPDTTEDRGKARVAQQSIRVSVTTLEHLMTMVSELVLTRNQLLEIMRRQQGSEFQTPLQRLSNVTAELQEGVMRTRMQPIGNAWQKLPRIVRDLCTELDKEIELELSGAETELDRQVLELIKDPLAHMVRNSADHGIETPRERQAAGKPPRGTIRLSATHEGGYIVIDIADDGRGLNTKRIKAKAMAAGLASESEIDKMSDAQIHRFVFTPAFSTAENITSVSGRGVGMDVVKSNIDQIGGAIDVKSVPGEGTLFSIKIPLTLAIISALIVEAGGDRFAVPQLAVLELVRVRGKSEHCIEYIKDTPVLRLRDTLLPVVDLRKLLKLERAGAGDGAHAKDGFIVVVQVGSQSFGVFVDGVVQTEEIVVKPMASKLRHIGMFSGNTILGDGLVILIIDPNGLADAVGSTSITDRSPGVSAKSIVSDAVVEPRVSMLVFCAGSAEPKAVPLSLVTRLEEIDGHKIELSNGRHLVQYRGQLMPLIRINDNVRVRRDAVQPLLVFSDGERVMGLVVDEIIDIVEEPLDIEVASDQAGILGSAIVKGRATEIVDVGYFLPLAHEDWLRRSDAGKRPAARTLLLVDDSAFFRNMLSLVLKAAGYAVTTVASAYDALALLKSGQRFGVIVTDLDMPGMDGFSFAEAVRGNPRTADMPIIALSSLTSPDVIERGRQIGFYDFVPKFDRPGLIAALKEQSGCLECAA